MSANCMLLELRERAATCDNAWKKPTAIRSSSTCQSMRSAESTSYTAQVGWNRGLSRPKAIEKAM